MAGFWETLKNNPALWSAPTLNKAYEDQRLLSAYEQKLRIAQKLEDEAAARTEGRRVLDRGTGEWIVFNKLGGELRRERALPDEIALQAATVDKATSEAERAGSEAKVAKGREKGGYIWEADQAVRDANIKQSNASAASSYQSIARDREAISDANRVEEDAITQAVAEAKGRAKQWAATPDVQAVVNTLDMDYQKYRSLDPNSPAAQALRREILAAAEELRVLSLERKDKAELEARQTGVIPTGVIPTAPANFGFNLEK